MNWQDQFYAFLADRGLVRNTIQHHIRMLTSEFIYNIIQKRYPTAVISDLDPNTSLYVLQADLCLSGQENWRDAWTSIEYFRLYKQSLSTDSTVNATELEKTFSIITSGQLHISQQLQSVLQEFSNRMAAGNERDELQNNREAQLISRERQLRIWEEDLRQREKELTEKYKGMCELRIQASMGGKPGRKAKNGQDYIRRTQNEEQRKWLKLRTKEIHASENLGTSNKLIFLMIVMRDVGFLYENIDITGFLRLMGEWEVLDSAILEDKKACKSIYNSMDAVKDRLPERGKRDFRSWTEAYAQDDRQLCEHLALLYESDTRRPE